MGDPNDIIFKKLEDLKNGEINMNLDIDDDIKEIEKEIMIEKKRKS